MGEETSKRNEIMNIQILGASNKKQLGEILKAKRDAASLSKYHFQKEGLRQELLNSIEEGSKKYAIDSLFKYIEILNAEEAK